METFYFCVIVICNKNSPNYNYFCFQQRHRIREDAEKQNHCHTFYVTYYYSTELVSRVPTWGSAAPGRVEKCLSPPPLPPPSTTSYSFFSPKVPPPEKCRPGAIPPRLPPCRSPVCQVHSTITRRVARQAHAE